MRAHRLAVVAAIALGGCTAPNPETALSLESEVVVTGEGVVGPSDVGVHRQGPVDPQGHDMQVAVMGSHLRLRTPRNGGETATLDALELELDDAELPPSPSLPQGLRIQQQRLVSKQPMSAKVFSRGPDGIGVELSGSLEYHASMLLADGTLYPLGVSQMTGEHLQIQVARTVTGVKVTLDAPPGTSCGEVGDLLTLSHCTVYVESAGTIATP